MLYEAYEMQKNLLAGASAYPRKIDFERIAEVYFFELHDGWIIRA